MRLRSKNDGQSTVLARIALASLLLTNVSRHVAAQQISETPSVYYSHPTIAEFQEEIAQADVVIRARVLEIVRRQTGSILHQDAVVEILETYKGQLEEAQPCVRMHVHQSMQSKRDQPGLPGTTLAEIGDEVILPIEFATPRVGTPPPRDQKLHYMSLFYYVVEKDGSITHAFGLPPDLQQHATLPMFSALIREAAARPQLTTPAFQLGEVLMTDDFDDGSLAGWTFLSGKRGFGKKPVEYSLDVEWLAPNATLINHMKFPGEPPTTTLQRDPKTGLYTGRHNNTVIEFGVAEGRFRMRSSHIWRHFTVVTGDPQWENYQVDVDVYNMVDIEQGHARANYRKFGPYGRVNVPNFPATAGEHSFVAVEFGNFASYDFSYGTYDSQTFQIRVKYPEPLFVWRDHSRQLRLIKVLDFQPWPIPEKQKIHMTAQYFGDYVAGFVNGEKVAEGRIPADHPGKQSGRIALWAFETWVEWDNLKVTQLVPRDSNLKEPAVPSR